MPAATPTPDPGVESPDSSTTRPRLPVSAIVVATVLATLAAVAVLLVANGSDTTEAPSTTPLDGGVSLTPAQDVPRGAAIDIAFVTMDGDEATIRDALDGPMVVNFFASWCPPCVGEMPEFEEAHRLLGDRVRFLGLAVSDRPEDARRIVESTGVTYGWGRDVRGDIAAAAGALSMPTTMFIATDGTVTQVRSGAIDLDTLLDLVAEHLDVVPESERS